MFFSTELSLKMETLKNIASADPSEAGVFKMFLESSHANIFMIT